MRRPWFAGRPVGAEFFDDAPVVLRDAIDIARPAPEVWAELTSDRPLAWCRILDEVTWTSPRPFGVGTTRTAKALRGATILHERFFRWEEGRRKSFYVLESSAPLVRSLAEDYLVEPTSETSCRFTWTVAYAPRAVARLADPANRRILATLFADTRRYFAA